MLLHFTGKDRQSRGGGVLIAVSSSVASCKLPSPLDVEAIAVKITLNKLQIIVCNCYIPPNSGDSYLDTLLTFLSNLISSHDRVIITGDFNLPDINWYFLTGHSSSSNSFCDFVFINNQSSLLIVLPMLGEMC